MPEHVSKNTDIDVAVFRGKGGGGKLATYRVAKQPSQTVLDVVTLVQKHHAPDLAYRFACRVGMCGTCAMTVNGKPRWTCRTHVNKVASSGKLRIEPLRNLPHIRDLVVDLAPFFEKQDQAQGRFVGASANTTEFVDVRPSEPERQQADAGIECIGCAVCYAACDVVAWKPDYLGPAALNRAWTLVNDRRDAAHAERLQAITQSGGCTECHSTGSCAEACPKHLNPTRAIAGLKRRALRGRLGLRP